MDLMKRRKILSFFVNLSIVFPVSFFALLMLSSPVASAQHSGSCDVPAVNDVTASNSISLEPVEESFWNNEGPQYNLQSDVFVDFTVDNDSATAVSMKLVPGYMYSFCISITSNQDDPPLNPSSDIYLMTQPNWDRYTLGYELREDDSFFEAFDELPVEWRDMDDWLPFRDVHAYEGLPTLNSRWLLIPQDQASLEEEKSSTIW